MPELTKHKILVPLDGLSQEMETSGTALGEETFNFYPDGEGYLVNYPGKVKYFRDVVPPEENEGTFDRTISYSPGESGPAQNIYTEPPDGKFTRVKMYRDQYAESHIVFVVDNKLCVAEGNGYRAIYYFKGQRIDGASYPTLFIHQNFLVIANLGDPILVWDGQQDVCPLGVTEIPDPPRVSVSPVPWYTKVGERPNEEGNEVMIGYFGNGNELAGGCLSKYGYWGNPGVWYSGPLNYEPGGTYHGLFSPGDYHDPSNWYDTYWKWKVRFFDKYGNLGPESEATPLTNIPKNTKRMSTPGWPMGSRDDRVSLADWDGKRFATVYWTPPKHDWHIAGSILYKTLDLHEVKANSDEVYYKEKTFQNCVQSRHTSMSGDSTLVQAATMSTQTTGPPSTDLAASWGTRIIIRDPLNKEKMLYSGKSKIGEFTPSRVYKAKDTIEALLPLGDRLMVVTNSTTEVLYYTSEGDIAHLETFENKGSYYGKSFAVFGDQAFGLFNDGFFLFDGQRFTKTNSPYFLKKDYIDRWHDVNNSVVQGEWYFLSTRKEMRSGENNFILMCHLPTSRWFQVKESVRDMEVSGDYIIGVSDSIYFLYSGGDYAASKIHMRGVLNADNGIMRQSTLDSLSLFLEPTSKRDVSVLVSGSNTFSERTGEAVSYPSKSTVTKDVNYHPYYNDEKSDWDDADTKWVAPNDFFIETQLTKNVTAFKHDIKFTFTGPQRVKAILVEYSSGSDLADSE